MQYLPKHQLEDPEDEQFNIECNLRKLLEMPWEQCPWPAVRSRMLRLAIEGAEIYAYRPTHQEAWVIWYPLDSQRDGRMSPREWAILHGYAIPAIPAVPAIPSVPAVPETTDEEGA